MELGNHTHVWRVGLDLGEPNVSSLALMLAPGERQRASRFHFDRDRRHFIAARGVLRQLLARYSGHAPEDIEFCYGPQGKPELADGKDLQFNIAHSRSVGLFAFTLGAPIGVDVERSSLSSTTSWRRVSFRLPNMPLSHECRLNVVKRRSTRTGRGRKPTSRRSAAD